MTQTKQKGFFLSLDAEKAFDRGMGLHGGSYTSHRYRTVFLRSDSVPVCAPFSQSEGQQHSVGCLPHTQRDETRLPPILYPFCPYSWTIPPEGETQPRHPWHTYTQQGIQIRRLRGDILLLLSQPLINLPVLLSGFRQFQFLSNLKINVSKSFALNISLSHHIVDQCKQNFPFQWKQDSITYIGIQLPSKLPDLYAKNYIPILNKLISDFKLWNNPSFS